MVINKISLKARALRYLAAREHSRKELAGKLATYLQVGDDLEALLDWLQTQGYLSETRFAEALVRQRAPRYGASRILHELQNRGIDGDDLEAAKFVLAEGEVGRAVGVWEKKFGTQPADMNERAKQIRFMQNRGFSLDVIRKVWRQEKNKDDQS